jgi:hypothetical protein
MIEVEPLEHRVGLLLRLLPGHVLHLTAAFLRGSGSGNDRRAERDRG